MHYLVFRITEGEKELDLSIDNLSREDSTEKESAVADQLENVINELLKMWSKNDGK